MKRSSSRPSPAYGGRTFGTYLERVQKALIDDWEDLVELPDDDGEEEDEHARHATTIPSTRRASIASG